MPGPMWYYCAPYYVLQPWIRVAGAAVVVLDHSWPRRLAHHSPSSRVLPAHSEAAPAVHSAAALVEASGEAALAFAAVAAWSAAVLLASAALVPVAVLA